jgi:23S rRNA (adenine2503-C2)-methyltransferase
MKPPDVKSLTLPALEAELAALGEKPFRARQLFRWLYKRDAATFDEMTDIAKDLRPRLAERFTILRLALLDRQVAEDGTQKLLLELPDGLRIECVIIPEERRLTLCVSSQVGCRWGCQFCRTGEMRFQRNLTAGEIVEQYGAAQRLLGEERISNVVLMGMGEPLDNLGNVVDAIRIFYADHGYNLSPRKMTLSTVGLVPQLDELGRRIDVSLAVSLHAADDQTRSRLVPANRRYPLKELLDACRRFPTPHRKRITFEYSLVAGVNDSDDDALRLARLAPDLRPKINLIAVNSFEGSGCEPPDEERVRRFQQILIDHHVTAIVRKPRGRDILAACGQLAARDAPPEE